MLTLVLILLVALTITMLILVIKDNDRVGAIIGLIFFGIGAITTAIYCVIMLCNVSTAHIIDEKITMYEEENAQIEEDIALMVTQYMEYEESVLENVSPNESAFVLISLFPELKADELVTRQINIYMRNASAIKELKENKINLSRSKWLLYFGK